MRLTPKGHAVASLALAAWALAFATGSVFATVFAVALASAIGYGVLSLRRPRVTAERTLVRDRFVEGERFTEQLTLRLISARSARVQVREGSSPGLQSDQDEARELILRHGEEARLEVRWRAETWGRKFLGPLRLRFLDAFELLEETVEAEGVRTLRVQPSSTTLGKFVPPAGNPEPALGAHNVSRPGDGSEFFALREYQPGDSIRRINWKATARSRNTIVNQVTRDSYARVLIFLDLRTKEDLGAHATTGWVRNGRAVASLVAHHDRLKDHVTLILLRDSAASASMKTNPRAEDLLGALGDVGPGGETSLHAALQANMREIRPRSPVYFVTSGALELELRDSVALAQALRASPIVVSPEPHGLESLEPEARRLVLESRRSALGEAASLGARVIEWREGRSLEATIVAS